MCLLFVRFHSDALPADSVPADTVAAMHAVVTIVSEGNSTQLVM